jgi:predicted HD phosphohydrolase
VRGDLWVTGGSTQARFERQPWQQEAVRVRRWNDRGEMTGLRATTLTDFAVPLERVFAAVSAAATHE